MSGQETGPRAAALRALLAGAEVPYRFIGAVRNRLFDSEIRKVFRLPRPVVSVGNLTTGGTGKTPVVRWLAERLRERGRAVAVLSRGYKSTPGELGDEQRMLADLLNRPGTPPVFIRASPDRLHAAEALLRDNPEVAAFILDDGFQHRRLARDFDLVLVSAAAPFGFGRVLPRGLLRESPTGLRRASAVLLTHADQADDAARARIVQTIALHNPAAPVYEAVHAPMCFRHAGAAEAIPVEAIRGRRWFAFCGIANPENFTRTLDALGGVCAGRRAFADHHDYTEREVADLGREAAACGADVMMTTEKDWVKISGRLTDSQAMLPIWRLDVAVRFRGDNEARLLADVERAIASFAAR